MSTHNPERTGTNRPETWNADNTLDAETRVPAPEHRDDKDKNKGSLKNRVIVALASLGLVGGGVAGYSALKGGEAPERTDTPSAGATKTPGETVEPTEAAPVFESHQAAVGQKFEDFEHLNVKPGMEVVKRAQQPTPASMSPLEAFNDLMLKENVYYLSGELQDTQGEQFETEDSLINGAPIIENMYSPNMPADQYNGAVEIRKSVALRTGVFPTLYALDGGELMYNPVTDEKVHATWNKSRENAVPLNQNDTSATFEVSSTINTNFGEVDRSDVYENDDIDVSGTNTLHVTIAIEGDKWLIQNEEFIG